jgi:hypothetical protein
LGGRDTAAVAHQHEKVRRWLERNPRVQFHFVPTGAAWLNLVERLFSELDQRQLKRLAVTSVGELVAAIETYLDDRNKTRSRSYVPSPHRRSSASSVG